MARRLRAESQARTGLAVCGGEFDLDDLVGSVVDGWGPATADMSFWTGGLLSLPVDEELAGIKARFVACLSAVLQKLTGGHDGREASLLLSLGCHSKQASDERNLPQDVPFFHTIPLSLPNDVHTLLSL